MASFTMGYTSIAVIVGLSVIHIGIGLTAVVLGIVMSSQVKISSEKGLYIVYHLDAQLP